eukprot:gene12113-5605_t
MKIFVIVVFICLVHNVFSENYSIISAYSNYKCSSEDVVGTVFASKTCYHYTFGNFIQSYCNNTHFHQELCSEKNCKRCVPFIERDFKCKPTSGGSEKSYCGKLPNLTKTGFLYKAYPNNKCTGSVPTFFTTKAMCIDTVAKGNFGFDQKSKESQLSTKLYWDNNAVIKATYRNFHCKGAVISTSRIEPQTCTSFLSGFIIVERP